MTSYHVSADQRQITGPVSYLGDMSVRYLSVQAVYSITILAYVEPHRLNIKVDA